MLMAAIKTNILFGPDHKLFRANLLKFINARINPFVDEWEQNKQFPVKKLFKELGNLGIFGVNKPKEFGGLDLDFTYSVAMAETMGHINCGGIPMAVAVVWTYNRTWPRLHYQNLEVIDSKPNF